jgi:competence protein ComEA
MWSNSGMRTYLNVLAALILMFNLNTATAGQLQRVPGIGPALAGRIVEFRTKKGKFKRIEDLLAVPGISEKKWRALRDYLTVE